MRTANHADVIRHGVISRHKAGLDGCANPDARTACHGDDSLMRHKAVDLHTNVASGEIVLIEAMNGNSISRYTKRIHGIRRQQVGVTNRGRLREVVKTTDYGVQNILGEAIWWRLEKRRSHVPHKQRVLVNDLIIR